MKQELKLILIYGNHKDIQQIIIFGENCIKILNI